MPSFSKVYEDRLWLEAMLNFSKDPDQMIEAVVVMK
jgi:hypothetical protein